MMKWLVRVKMRMAKANRNAGSTVVAIRKALRSGAKPFVSEREMVGPPSQKRARHPKNCQKTREASYTHCHYKVSYR
jgi:hypothetical protein